MDPFDELAQALARGISRREAFRRFAGGLAAALVATVVPWESPAVARAISLNISGVSVSGASVSGVSVSGAQMPPNAPKIASLEMSSQGARVEALQLLLRQHGAEEVVVDGDFGEQTEGAVFAFQKKNDLPFTGVVEMRTWEALFVAVQRGDQGDAVGAAQTLLNTKGQEVVVDGDFGQQTEGAVVAFQKATRGLTADGIVKTPTWIALVGI